MKMTLLDMVSNILLATEGDRVSLWNDTDESQAIGHALQEVYFQMISNGMIPEHFQLFQLTSAGGTAKVFMEIPDSVARIEWLKYNKIESGDTDNAFGEVHYREPEAFMKLLLQRKSSDVTTVSVTDPTSSLVLDMIGNNSPPTYWTSFDDHYICFDSYDEVVDATGLIASKTLCWGPVWPTWTFADGFIPDMDDNLFPFLLAETKSLIFVNQKQQANPKVEKQANRQRFALQNDKYRTRASQKEGFASTGPNYGRCSRK
jgi:hypothetical protein